MNMDNQKVAFRILKFWTTYSPDGKGGMKATDMVAYAPIGEANLSVATEAVSRISKVVPWEPGSENIAVFQANQRWNIIKPAYEAWKNGHALPESGTALGAWPGIAPDTADALRMAGIRTVEEVAEMSDGIATRLPIPGLRDLRITAAAFLKAADRTKISTDLAKKDEELASMRAEMEEMRQLLKAKLDDDTPKRKPQMKPDAKLEKAEAA